MEGTRHSSTGQNVKITLTSATSAPPSQITVVASAVEVFEKCIVPCVDKKLSPYHLLACDGREQVESATGFFLFIRAVSAMPFDRVQVRS